MHQCSFRSTSNLAFSSCVLLHFVIGYLVLRLLPRKECQGAGDQACDECNSPAMKEDLFRSPKWKKTNLGINSISFFFFPFQVSCDLWSSTWSKFGALTTEQSVLRKSIKPHQRAEVLGNWCQEQHKNTLDRCFLSVRCMTLVPTDLNMKQRRLFFTSWAG